MLAVGILRGMARNGFIHCGWRRLPDEDNDFSVCLGAEAARFFRRRRCELDRLW